jgi:hypothetical protein
VYDAFSRRVCCACCVLVCCWCSSSFLPALPSVDSARKEPEIEQNFLRLRRARKVMMHTCWLTLTVAGAPVKLCARRAHEMGIRKIARTHTQRPHAITRPTRRTPLHIHTAPPCPSTRYGHSCRGQRTLFTAQGRFHPSSVTTTTTTRNTRSHPLSPSLVFRFCLSRPPVIVSLRPTATSLHSSKKLPGDLAPTLYTASFAYMPL